MKTIIPILAASAVVMKILILILSALAVAMIIAALILAFAIGVFADVTDMGGDLRRLFFLKGGYGIVLSSYITGITVIGVSTIVAVVILAFRNDALNGSR